MAIAVEMPKMSDTMTEGVLVAWLAEEGDTVAPGDIIAQVETDKATMDLEAYDDGVLLKKVIAEGEAVPIGGLIAVLGKEGEDPSDILAKYQGGDGAAPAKAPETEPEAEAEPEAETEEASEAPEAASTEATEAPETPTSTRAPVASVADGAATSEEGGRIKASPLARRLAQEHDINLRSVTGSGPEGRIIKRDIEAAISAPAQPEVAPAVAPRMEAPAYQRPPAVAPSAEAPAYEAVRISQMRKTIARRLAQSKYTAPHFYLTIDVDMARAVDVRKQLNALAEAQGSQKISFNDIITKACAAALRQHPEVNASYLEQEGEIRQYDAVHVAVAVAVDEGLVTPVIRNADQKGLTQIAAETRALAEKARDRKLQPQEMEGSTFTTSNLGMFGIEEFTAIINPPNACILAIGGIREVPVVKDGEVVPGTRMKVTLSCDHRIVDGAVGARFMETLRGYLEEPMTLLL